MEKKKSTNILPPGVKALTWGLFFLLGAATVGKAQTCDLPAGLTVVSVTQTTATLQWTSQNGPVTDHCWNVSVGGVGFDPTNGTAVFAQTICEGDAGVSIAGNTVTYTVTGLQPGTSYEWCISETCDGMAPPDNVSGWQCDGVFVTFDDNFTLAPGTITRPTCPLVSPGFQPDGSFQVVVSDGTTCAGSYNVVITGGPYATTPTGYFGVSQGTYTFTDAGPGTYTVTVTDLGTCNPEFNPVNINIAVPDGIDNIDPQFTVTDILGNVVVASTGPTTANLGTVIIPEGSCSYQQQLFAFGTDNCDGGIVAANAVTATATTTPATINPGTQVGVTPGGFGFYEIDINWSIGSSDVTITGADAAGNTTVLTITAFVDDNVNPVVTIVGANNTTIPACADTRDIIVTVYVDDGCDQNVTVNNLSVNFGGNPFFLNFPGDDYFEYVVTVGPEDDGDIWSATYVDDFGNVGFTDLEITVEQAAEDLPAVVIAADENVTVPVCDGAAPMAYSFQILDDCADINLADLSFDDDGSGLTITFTDVDNANNTAFVEATGIVAPGVYILEINYQGTIVEPLINVIEQQDSDPTIVLPGNLSFTIPVCEADLTTTFSITISDDCDDPINAGNTSFTLGGAPITPTFTNAAAGYFEFTETLSAANDGDLLLAQYTDGGGNTTIVDALLTVTAQPDNWAPIVIYPSQDINVTLDPCAPPSATVFFEVTATDNCDGDLTPTVSVAPAQGITNAIILPSLGGDTYVLVAEPGVYQVTIEVTDAAGNTREEDFFVNIAQDLAPEVSLACNNNLNIALNQDCEALVTPDLLLEGNFGCLTDADFEIVVVDSDISNGPIVDGPGTYNYEVTLGGSAGIFGFTGPFEAQNWDVIELGGPFGDDIVTITPDLATLISGGNGASMSIAMPNSGTLSFDFDYIIEDDIIMDVFLVDINGNEIINIDTGSGSGSVSVDVEAGWVLVIAIDGDGFQTGGVDTEIEITNFSLTGALGGDPGDFTTCWGTLTVEDKTAPTIDCPDDTNEAMVQNNFQTITGSYAAGDAEFVLTDYACFLEVIGTSANPDGLPYRYDLNTFTVSQTDTYTFFLQTSNTNIFNGLINNGLAALFQGSFNPENPCEDIVYSNGQVFGATTGLFLLAPGVGFQTINNFDPVARITLPLQAGQTYTLMTTTVLPESEGDYNWTIFSDGNGVVNGGGISTVQAGGLIVELVCAEEDLDLVQITGTQSYTTNAAGTILSISTALNNKLELTGFPTVADNCGDLTVSVSDQVATNGDCGDVVITRTFIVEDAFGRTDECQQLITIRRPALPDVIFPPLTAFLECDEGFPTDANGNPSPSVTGYPFLETATGFIDIDNTVCNLATQYEDQETIEICGGSYKLTRLWTVVDWCDPANSRQFNQLIKVGDYTGPQVSCPEADYDGDGQPDLLTYSTGPFNCTAAFQAPLPTVTDNCSDWGVLTEIVTDIEVDVTDQYGQVIGTETQTIIVATLQPNVPRFVSGIPTGQHRFRYTATDDCGNETVLECDFRVIDQVEPIAICNDDLNISIGAEGFARVNAEDIDEGSWDNCGPVRIEVRRLVDENENCDFIPEFFTPWSDHVDFNCCDVGDTVTIELRVWDDADQDGIVGGPGDNNNTCWLEVLVEDKIVPECVAPENVSLDCTELPYDLDPYDINQLEELFGPASTLDNCSADWQELPPIVNLTDCRFGTISRRFRAIDHYGNVSVNTCHQIITVNEVHDYEIKFPRDAASVSDPQSCGTVTVDTLEYSELGCDLLAISVEDETFSASDDECYKIFRTYRIINWCEYDGESDPVVVSRDEDCDGVPGDEDIWVLVRPNGVTYFDRDNNENNSSPLPFAKGTSCDGLTNPQGHWINSTFDANATRDPITGEEDILNQGEGLPADVIRDISSRGFWQYTQHIKVYDNIDPVVYVGGYDPFCSWDNDSCEGPVEIPFTVFENCTTEDVVVKEVFLDAFWDGADFQSDFTLADGNYELTGEYPHYTLLSDGLPIGDHAFEVHVEDGCGNLTALIVPFVINDCKAPSPACINGLSVELMPTEPGTDVNGDGNADSGARTLWAIDFIVSPYTDCSGPVTYSINRAGETPDPNQTSIVLTCDDLGTVIVEVYAWDAVGLNDYCETYIFVQDNLNNLCNGASIAGVIETEQQNGVEAVEVSLSGNLTGTVNTGNSGAYEFLNLETGYDYSIQPILNVHHFNGVSTLDLVLISKHILGEQPLSSPYKMIAADVNNSGTVSTLDLIQARKGILGLIDEYPNNTSWRFVDATYVFPNVLNPWEGSFPEILNFNDLAGEVTGADFVAIKIGDVNGTATHSSLLAVDERDLTGAFHLSVPEMTLAIGQTYTVPFTAQDLAKIQGYQFTLGIDPAAVELVDLQYGTAGAEHFGMRFLEEGIITTSWHRTDETPVENVVLFSLVFTAKRGGQLSEVLSLHSSYTRAEAYDQAYGLLGVALVFDGDETGAPAFTLHQNRPNPFRQKTWIGFDLPVAGRASLKVYDLTGHLVRIVRLDATVGYNELLLTKEDLPAPGVYYYSLETDTFQDTRRMILIE